MDMRYALTPEASLGDEVNGIGSKLKQLQEQLQKLEKQNDEGNEKMVADWGLQIRQLYRNISDIEDEASQLLRRSNGKGVGGLAKTVFFSLSQRKENREIRSRIRQVQEKMEKLNEDITHRSSKGKLAKLDRLTARCDHQKSENNNRVNQAVGMDEKIKRLVSFLEKDSSSQDDDCPFFAVYGMGGVGKTTLVRMVYNTPNVRHKFMGCAWITSPHKIQTKTLWQDIMSQIEPGKKDEIKELNDRALGKSLRSSLQSKKYLIVLDDVGSTEALLIALPANTMRSSKIVITTRDKAQAAKIVCKTENILQMGGLTIDESWDLFLKTQLPCHISEFEENQDLKEICRDVVKKCEGLPLAIKVIGDLMAGKHTMEQWKLLQHKNSMSAEDTLELSYNLLPEHLKKCLLYLALFPKDTDIEAEKLYNLWIAEGMISCEHDGNSTMLSTAETYLKELASLGLVEVREEETPTLTDIKSCRIHDLVRDLCSRKGKEESLFAAVDLRAAHKQSSGDNVRALAYYFDKRVGKYEFSLKPETSRQIRSFLFLNAHLPDEHLPLPKSLAFKNFRFLRVLDFNSLDFYEMKLPKDMENLATLRYLSFRDCCLDELSSSIGKLPNLEILDLRVNPMLDMSISNVLFKLTNLRNIYFPYKFHAVGDQKLQLDGLSMLENLKNFVSSNCRANDLLKLGSLKYLAATIEGNMEDLEVTINCINQRRLKSKIDLKNFDCYSQRRHSALRNLLGCKFVHTLHMEGHIGKLSWPNSSKLTQIFLIGSELTEDPMPVLGNFPQLHKLGLCNGAFLGESLVCSASSFPKLRYFKLSNLYKLKIWSLEQGAMPKLSTLTIERCQSLETLPDGLSTNLQELSTVKMDESFTAKFRSEGEDFFKIQHVPIIKVL